MKEEPTRGAAGALERPWRVLLDRAAPEIASLWTSPPVAWIGRAGLATVAIVWGAALARDVAEVL